MSNFACAGKRRGLEISTADSKSNKKSISHHSADIKAGQRVLKTEADALVKLADSLNQDFSQAVSILMGVKGRVIVSGLGKSGHIARKITATLASTGTPAQHVHPSEASHGDLGMITRDDAVIMLSNSGENRELSDLIAHTRLVGIPLIAISSRPNSTLMEASDIGLLLPEAPEACPMGMAPTTSSTMMLALGDALGVALMERRGFSKDDYRVLHPGGKLGQSLVRVADVMHTGDSMPLVKGDVPMSEMLATLVEKRFGCVGVLDEAGGLVGIFTDGDLGRNLDSNLMNKSAYQVMTKTPKVIRDTALLAEAAAMMRDMRIWVLFVFRHLDERNAPRPIGLIHVRDSLKAGFE
jgi:arabinose-5-phosphate isomerase